MTIAPQSEADPLGEGQLWEDLSGGSVLLAINHPDYTSQHRFHVPAFGSSGAGVFNSPPSGTTANISQETDNLASLLAPLFDSGSSGQFYAVYQTTPDNTNETPYAYTFTGTPSFTGSGSGTRWFTWITQSIVGLDAGGGRWKLVLPGTIQSAFGDISRGLYSSQTTVVKALMDYLSGKTNGPVHAVKTNVVSHNGQPLIGTMSVVGTKNKRLARHFRVA